MMIFFVSILVQLSISVNGGASPEILSGDENPPGYSVIDLDLDTIEGPVSVKPSVIGYVNSLEGKG